MAYDLELEQRLKKICGEEFQPKKMFGGVVFFLNGKMCVGIHKDLLILRVGPQKAEELLKKPHVRPMDFTGKVMKGWAMVEKAGFKSEAALKGFVKNAKDFVEIL